MARYVKLTSKHVRATQHAYAKGYTIAAPARLVDICSEDEFSGIFGGRYNADNNDQYEPEYYMKGECRVQHLNVGIRSQHFSHM